MTRPLGDSRSRLPILGLASGRRACCRRVRKRSSTGGELMRVRAGLVFGLLIGAIVAVVPSATPAQAAVPAFVQARANEVNSGRTNSLAFTNANRAGDLVVVTVLWNNRGAVTVADTRGNTYASAAPSAAWNNSWSQQTFYAKNVAAGANTRSEERRVGTEREHDTALAH